MKNLFSALVLTLVMGTSAYASTLNFNSQKPVNCMTTEEMKNLIGGKYLEMPYMQGVGIAPATDGQQFIKTTVVIALNIEYLGSFISPKSFLISCAGPLVSLIILFINLSSF